MTSACAKRTGTATSMERRRREPARAISLERQHQSFDCMRTHTHIALEEYCWNIQSYSRAVVIVRFAVPTQYGSGELVVSG